jgi:branched-chain amino acid transport system substrate-binding protein
MRKLPLILNTLALACALGTAPAQAADRVKVGFISTLSGPSAALGVDIRDAFLLAVKQKGGKLGGLPAEVVVADDQLSPETGVQIADRMLKRDRVNVLTGIVFSNVLLAVAPKAFESGTVYISPNAGPTQFAGEQCNRLFFSTAWQNDINNGAPGLLATQRGYANVMLIAPNYQAGKDALDGFKSFYNGKVIEEVYTKLGQLDYSAELAQIRAAKPQAVFFFLPGGMGINFIKQFVAAGLSRETTLLASGVGADADVIRAVGDPMLGLFNTSHWAMDLPNDANRAFVEAFRKEYGRVPTQYAAQGWDDAQLIDAAVRDAKGRIEDQAAFIAALRAKRFASVRGDFRWGVNNYPIQNWYLRVVSRGSDGQLVNKSIGTVATDLTDRNAARCNLKW